MGYHTVMPMTVVTIVTVSMTVVVVVMMVVVEGKKERGAEWPPRVPIAAVPPIGIPIIVGIRVRVIWITTVRIAVRIIRVGGITTRPVVRTVGVLGSGGRLNWGRAWGCWRALCCRLRELCSNFPSTLQYGGDQFVRNAVLLQRDNFRCSGIICDGRVFDVSLDHVRVDFGVDHF